MVVAVVKVGYMRMGMLDGLVGVAMRVRSVDDTGVFVVVVFVVVAMLVFVLDDVVAVCVFMGGAQGEGDADGGERDGESLDEGDGVAEEGPRERGPDERSGCEDDLASSRSQIAGSLDPQCDGGPVAECADEQCCGDLADLDLPGGGDGEAEDEVGSAGDGTLGQGDLFGAELVDAGGDAVVDAPGDARSDDEQPADIDRCARFPHEQHTGEADEKRSGEQPSPEVLAEHERGERDRGDELEIQQQRRRRCGDASRASVGLPMHDGIDPGIRGRARSRETKEASMDIRSEERAATPEDTNHNPASDRQADGSATSERRSYMRFGAMILTSMVVMFGIMYLNTYEFSHVHWSETRFYMTFIMGAAMAVVMLSFMWSMHENRKVNVGIYVGAAIVFAGALWLVRSQATIEDTSYMRAMIPHHSIAVLTSENAQIGDARVRELADEIIASQCREIAEMEWLINDIDENGEVTTAAEAEQRPVPEFSEKC